MGFKGKSSKHKLPGLPTGQKSGDREVIECHCMPGIKDERTSMTWPTIEGTWLGPPTCTPCMVSPAAWDWGRWAERDNKREVTLQERLTPGSPCTAT